MVRSLTYLFFLFISTSSFSQTESGLAGGVNYIVDGTWYREDGSPRRMFSIPEGVKLVTEDETYIYYQIGENQYQMNWTPSQNGTRYRWTMTVKSLTTIENTYENEVLSGRVTYSYTRILE